VILRLCLAVVVGSVVGFEREYTAHAAGLRTHMLVALGAALFTLAGVVVEGADPTRVAGLCSSKLFTQ
jgi:putative Mg2+ transporter-C (MgtC) family protein